MRLRVLTRLSRLVLLLVVTVRAVGAEIHLQDGTTLKGRIEEVGPEGLTLVQGGSVTQTAVSASIFAASAGYLMDKKNPTVTDRLGMALAGSIIFGGIGAGVGAATGTAEEGNRLAIK